MPCEKCPCPDICLERPEYCDWAKKEIPVQAEIEHICGRSTIAIGQPRKVYPREAAMRKEAAEHIVVSTNNGNMQRIPVADSIRLTQLRNSCPHFSKYPPCGCGGGRCDLGKGRPDPPNGSIVTFWDCANCLQPGNPIYEKNSYKI
jgi:hypothetical protein